MKSGNPTVKDNYLKTLQSASIPPKVSKVFTLIMEQFFQQLA